MKEYFACFDTEKAYDRVDMKVLGAVLKNIRINVKVVNTIRSLHEDTKAIYKLGELESG